MLLPTTERKWTLVSVIWLLGCFYCIAVFFLTTGEDMEGLTGCILFSLCISAERVLLPIIIKPVFHTNSSLEHSKHFNPQQVAIPLVVGVHVVSVIISLNLLLDSSNL